MADTLLYNIPGYGLVYADAVTLRVLSAGDAAGVSQLGYVPGAGTAETLVAGSRSFASVTALTSGGAPLTGSFPVSDAARLGTLTVADISRAPRYSFLTSGQVLSGATLSTGDAAFAGQGAAVSLTQVNNGANLVVNGGVASAVAIEFGGNAFVKAGSSVFATVEAGGTLTLSGGANANASVSGVEAVFGGISFADVVHGGGEVFVAGGAAVSADIVSGGVLVVSGGDATNAYADAGGNLFVLAGSDERATVASGGTLTVSGGTDSGSTVQAGGIADAVGRGVILGATVSSGGTLELQAGGVASGTTLLVGGRLDLATLAFGPAGSAGYDAVAGLLRVTEGGRTVTQTLTSGAAGFGFALADDGSGGTLVTAVLGGGVSGYDTVLGLSAAAFVTSGGGLSVIQADGGQPGNALVSAAVTGLLPVSAAAAGGFAFADFTTGLSAGVGGYAAATLPYGVDSGGGVLIKAD